MQHVGVFFPLLLPKKYDDNECTVRKDTCCCLERIVNPESRSPIGSIVCFHNLIGVKAKLQCLTSSTEPLIASDFTHLSTITASPSHAPQSVHAPSPQPAHSPSPSPGNTTTPDLGTPPHPYHPSPLLPSQPPVPTLHHPTAPPPNPFYLNPTNTNPSNPIQPNQFH